MAVDDWRVRVRVDRPPVRSRRDGDRAHEPALRQLKDDRGRRRHGRPAGGQRLDLVPRGGRDAEQDRPREHEGRGTYDTGTVTPGTAVPLAGFVWICECEVGRVAQFDPSTGEIVKELDLPEHGFVIGVDTTDPQNERVWLLDPQANTLTPIDPVTGEVGRSVGVGGAAITDAKVVGDSL